MTEHINTIIQQGKLFTVTTGEYSDYNVSGVFRALKELDTDRLIAEFVAQDKSDRPYGLDDRFIIWLIRQNLIEQIECHEMHVDDGWYHQPKLSISFTQYEGTPE